jgi:Holliday junction resolvase RusA-like endonuclease
MTAKLLATISDCSDQQFSFFVSGKPETQGSKSAFGRVYTDRQGKQRVAVAMAEQSKGLYAWRSSIGRVALLMRPKDWRTDGIFVLSAIFYMPRPKIHFNNKGQLKPSAPVFHAKLGDADKLLRACGDALTKICYDDDALIVAASSIKVFCDPEDGPGVHVSVSRLHEAGASAMALALKP